MFDGTETAALLIWEFPSCSIDQKYHFISQFNRSEFRMITHGSLLRYLSLNAYSLST